MKSAAADLIRMVVPRTIRNWLRSPSKSARWLLDSIWFCMGGTKSIEFESTLSLKCHPHVYRAMLEAQVNDAEQRAEFHRFLSLCTPNMYLFDIGAHYGAFSVAAALQGGRALAIDPSPIATRMIAKQACLNKCDKNIEIVRSAVSDSNGVIGLLSSGVFSHGFFKVVNGRPKRELTDSLSITVDELVRRFGQPTHIKVDVEGHEAAVLRGARAFLAECSPILLLELHNEMVRSERGDPKAALEEITSLGFTTFSLAGCLLTRDEILSKAIIRLVARRGTTIAGAGAAKT